MNDIDRLKIRIHDGVYTLMFLFPADGLIGELGIDGESAAREGCRQFGRDRGLTNRNNHLKRGLKINMRNYFTYVRDIAPNPLYARDRLTLTAQERISHTLRCPIYEMSAKHGVTRIGRIFCEEFHDAAFGTYAYGHTQVNLARTLTQDGDMYCSFSVLLRPENLPEELRPVCFEEYDPGYVFPTFDDPVLTPKAACNSLALRMYAHLLDAAHEMLGGKGVTALLHGVERVALETAVMLRHLAEEQKTVIDRDFAEINQPFALEARKERMWETYSSHNARDLFQKSYCDVLLRELGLPS